MYEPETQSTAEDVLMAVTLIGFLVAAAFAVVSAMALPVAVAIRFILGLSWKMSWSFGYLTAIFIAIRYGGSPR